ncbi:MAG TPA: PEGA domain-containing protein, partial [Kofleriaceae bacterium]
PTSEAPLHTPSEIHTLDEELPGVGVARPVRRGSTPPYAKKKKAAAAALQQNDSFVGEVPPGFRESPWPPEPTPHSRASSVSPVRVTGHELRGRSPWPMVLALLVFGTGAAALAYVLKKDGMATPAADTAAAPVEPGETAPAATASVPVAPPTPAATSGDAAKPDTEPGKSSMGDDDGGGQVVSAIPGGAPPPRSDKKDNDKKDDDDKAAVDEKDDDKKDDDKKKSRSSKRDRDKEKDREREKEKDQEKEKSSTTTATSKVATAPKGSGFLTINAEPYATVYVDGKKRGFTPVVRLALPAGEHSIKLVSSAGQSDRRMTVKVSSGQEVRKFVKW